MRSIVLRFLMVLVLIFCAAQVVGRVVFRGRLPLDPSAFSNREVERSAVGVGGPAHLVVLFHGYTGKPMSDVRATVREAFPGADVLAPQYSTSAFTNEDPLNIVREYLRVIDHAQSARTYDRITFVGYSLGALIARKVLVCAYTGCSEDFPLEHSREWRSRVDRMVLLAGMNRGWATHCEKVVAVEQAEGVGYDNDCRASNLGWGQWFAAELGERFGSMFGVGRLILAVERGQPFVANLRIEWLELQEKEKLPSVVQLLGDVDEIVSLSDNLDQFVTTQFVFIPLQRTTHSNVIQLTGPDGAARRNHLVRALTWPIDRLRETYPQPPNPDYKPDPGVTRVVMIVHGIRDDGLWARNLGREFQKTDPSLRAFSRSYGYFSALYFLTPTRMEANVRWFVDQYTQLRALYPKADFNFVGHSNGTYMLAESLARYHAVKFDRVVFAGSVVRTGFPWSIYANRVGGVRNYRASRDFVVAALPSFFEHVRGFLDVGGAGHAGFIDEFARKTQSRFFAAGGHGAVFGYPENYPALINYVLRRGDCPDVSECDAYELPVLRRTDTQSIWAVLTFKFCVLLWLVAILLVGIAAYAAWRAAGGSRPQRTRGSQLARSAMAGLAVVGSVLVFLRYY